MNTVNSYLNAKVKFIIKHLIAASATVKALQLARFAKFEIKKVLL